MTTKLLMSGTALIAILSASPLAAQGAPAEAPAADDGGIGDIIVTAQKRSESIQKVPVAVSALSQAELEKPTVQDIADIAGRVPGLVVDTVAAGPSAAAISIRGISFEDIEKSFDPAVGVVVDGVFIGTNTGQLLDSFDLSGLEVLRGPQGTLFGRNTIGGVINVTRTKPTGEWGAKVRASYGNLDTKQGRLLVNTETLGGVLALKGFVYYDETDGYYHNAFLNKRQGRYETLSGGVTALITPADNVEALVTYEHSRERGELVVTAFSETGKDVICLAIPDGAGGFIRPFAPANECDRTGMPYRGGYTVFMNAPAPLKNNTDAITANIDIDIGRFTLTSVTGYRKNRENVSQDFDGTSADFFATNRRQTFWQFSQELRLAGDLTDWLNVLGGLYYYDSNYKLLQMTRFGPGLLDPVNAVPLRQDVDHDATSYAAFGDVQIKPTDRLSIGLGARYTRDKKAIFNNYGQVPALVQLSQPAWDGECVQITGLLAPGVPAYGPGSNCEAGKSFNKFTWRANASYEVADDKRVYAAFSRGFRSGGFNGRASSPTSLGPYEPEIVDAYEVGLKADWLDRRLRTNIAIYQTDYSNKQEEVVQPSPPGAANPQETVVKNASTARIRGFEAEIVARPADELTLTASMAYTDAEYRNFFNDVNGDGVPDNVSTLTLRRAPKWAWSVGADYSREVGNGTLNASALFRFVDNYMTCIVPAQPIVLGQVTNDPRCLAEKRQILDASIGYTTQIGGTEVGFTIFGRNLTNDRGIGSTLPVAGLFTFGTERAPRTYGAQVEIKF